MKSVSMTCICLRRYLREDLLYHIKCFLLYHIKCFFFILVKTSAWGLHAESNNADLFQVHENGKLSFKYRLNGHRKPIVVVAWSPDNQQLLTCGQEEVVRRWDVTSGECLSTYDISGVSLISCGWCSDGRRVFCIADDTVYFLDLAGTELTYWNGIYGNRISDMAVTKDGKYISSSDNRIFAHDGTSRYAMGFMEPAAITSFSLSSDDKYLLVNLACQVIDLFGIVDGFPHLMRYSGHKRSRFVIRSCLGGSDQAFVASGSEDSQVQNC